MCVICIKESGVKMPSVKTIEKMWNRNPHGAGFMYARDNKVIIKKGFMTLIEFIRALENENITENEAVIMHFRIATQGGINKEMCHPFPLSSSLSNMTKLDTTARYGIAHNGIIPITSTGDKRYSDTALFITEYLKPLIHKKSDFFRHYDTIKELLQSKMVVLNGNNEIILYGMFYSDLDGLIYSNTHFDYTGTYYSYNEYAI